MATNPAGDHESARDREDDDNSVRALPSLDEKLMHIDLAAALEQLRHEDGFASSGRNAMTIVKYRDLRIVLELMQPGARIDDPRPETGGAVVIQVLSGRLRLEAEGQTIDLAAGRLVALDHIVPSQLTAIDESAFLIWVSWAERAAQEEARGPQP
jgi:quercetin dioxygenase-like cupin family protein